MSASTPTSSTLPIADTTGLTKNKPINKALLIAIPIILTTIVGIALAAATAVVILATKGSIFKSLSAKICQNSNNILGCTQNATSFINLQFLQNGVTQQLLTEYESLKNHCRLIISELISVYGPDVIRSNVPGMYITQYLNSIGTAEAMRLLKDLRAMSFRF